MGKPVVWSVFLLLSAPLALRGAQNRCESIASWVAETEPVALKYAPIFWFAPGERYLPTMPFLSAFDGRDNEGMGVPDRVDMADPGEIAALGAGGRPSWDLLHTEYTADPRHRTEYAAVLYRVVRLNPREIDHLWRYLISDEQAWARLRRVEDPELLSTLRSDTTGFLSIEYHSYHLRDFGLVGHYWDTEYTQLYVPAEPGLADRFRIVIGAGHTERVPNNVLVLSGERAEREKRHPVVLVELGTHSTAPDVRPYGVFQPGLDVNWHSHDVWGVRDAAAVTGGGALGPYELWQTFPRTERSSILLEPPALEEAPVAPRAIPGAAEEQPEVSTYALVPAEPLECISDSIDRDPGQVDVGEVEWMLSIVASSIRRSKPEWKFQGFEGLDDEEKRAAIAAMRRWTEGLIVTHEGRNHRVGPEKILLWRSKHYVTPPSAALKQHLFRPTAQSLQRFGHYLELLNVWLTWHPTSAAMIQAGFEVPSFWLPFRLPGYLEAQFGLYLSCEDVVQSCAGGPRSFAASFQHTGQYRVVTWYGRITVAPDRQRVLGDASASDWLIAGGLTIPLPPIRMRFGISTDLQHNGPRPEDMRWELVLSGV